MRKSLLIVAVSGIAVTAFALSYPASSAEAQSGSRTTREAPSGSRTAKRAHYDILWSWLQRSDYKKWNGVNGKAPDFQEGESPHGALIKTYINKEAAKDLKNLSLRSVIVKENYSPDKKLMAITVMQRSKGYDTKHGDWYYAKYMPDGKIARTPPKMKSMPIAGKFMKCIDCHAGADGNDFAYFND